MPSAEQQASDRTSSRRVGVPDVRGLSAEAHELLHVRLKLNARPPTPWVDGFDGPPNAEPGHEGASRRVLPDLGDGDLESSVLGADDRIERADRAYETAVLPPIRAPLGRHRLESEDRERRLRDARERAAGLGPAAPHLPHMNDEVSLDAAEPAPATSRTPDTVSGAGL
jgi:hypothetical protein